MRLWMWYVDGDDDQIEEACRAGNLILQERGYTVEQAFNAVVEANELPEEHNEESTPDSSGVAAWYAAEYAALAHLAHAIGTWPYQGSLICSPDEDAV